jgi:transposase
MSLIHTAELSGANLFNYLSELQRHAGEFVQSPAQWMQFRYHNW